METTLTSIPYSQKHQLDLNPTTHIETSTLEYLHVAFLLWEYKCTYSKREYRALLDTYGWDKGTAEEKRALKIAENFQEFATCPQHLAPIPVTILLKLCSKKYQPIISQLQDYPIGGLTCDRVLELIEERKALLKAEKQRLQESEEEKPSVWRRTPKGDRYCQFPPLCNTQQLRCIFCRLFDVVYVLHNINQSMNKNDSYETPDNYRFFSDFPCSLAFLKSW